MRICFLFTTRSSHLLSRLSPFPCSFLASLRPDWLHSPEAEAALSSFLSKAEGAGARPMPKELFFQEDVNAQVGGGGIGRVDGAGTGWVVVRGCLGGGWAGWRQWALIRS